MLDKYTEYGYVHLPGYSLKDSMSLTGFSSNIIKAEMQQAEPEKNDSTYMPSLSSNRRPERKKESSASLFPTPKLGLV